MSLWAWLTYSSLYTWTMLKAPLSISLWQHLYSLNVLLVIQETADTFGLVCLSILFLSAQILSRNFMFSIFLLAPSSSLTSDNSARSDNASYTSNRVSILTKNSSSLPFLKTLLTSSIKALKDRLVSTYK